MASTTQIGKILLPFLAVAGVGVGVGCLINHYILEPRKKRAVVTTIFPFVILAELGGGVIALSRHPVTLSTCHFERLFPFVTMLGVGVGLTIPSFLVLRKDYSAAVMFQKRKRVRDINYFIQEPDENYFSRLPDDIICHIISYLDLKHEAQTFVLSRRWRRIYYILLPNPKFECHKMIEFATLTEHNSCHLNYKQRIVTAVDEMFELVSLIIHGNCHCNDKQRFVTAVDTFLRLRTGLPVELFTLQFRLRRGFSGHLQRWLDCIVMTSVRKLDMNFYCEHELRTIPSSQLIVFPFKVLSSACMLEYVTLSFCVLEPNCQGPFNSLKELNLDRVSLVNGEVESILSCCPQLKLLKLVHCNLPSKLVVNSLELRTLEINYCERVNQIGFSAPNLDSFWYLENCGLSFLPSYVPNLRSLYLHLNCHKRPPQGFGCFVLDAPWLHTLWIQATPLQVHYIQKEMPILSNLDSLSLHVIEGSLDLRDIISLIAVCPNLSQFVLSSPLCSLNYTERDAEVPLMCVSLKLVVLDGFKFEAAQKEFASQLIRCAPALQEMRIYTAYCLYLLGRNVEITLPSRRRVFSDELISLTKQQLELQASSPLAVVSISRDKSTS